ncbi:SpoIIAA-like [Monaibacterium marinum]|uniref:SpoIIAA-like n=1 Tax=Pontivivens marinum TaxID=1690039 RepID=A0A2C9CM95_9RHOB|nr:STAS/SEC14 domain-containing protein [Monaibacterium marinum]SOH92383.1 SpoIIAA-like [Monaibacterium marinum]
MIEVTLKDPNHIELTATGRIEGPQMETALDKLIALCEPLDHATYLAVMTDINMPAGAAITAEIARLPKLMGLLRKIDKAAIITNQNWLRTAAEIEGKLIPNLEIRCFDDLTAARAWVTT